MQASRKNLQYASAIKWASQCSDQPECETDFEENSQNLHASTHVSVPKPCEDIDSPGSHRPEESSVAQRSSRGLVSTPCASCRLETDSSSDDGLLPTSVQAKSSCSCSEVGSVGSSMPQALSHLDIKGQGEGTGTIARIGLSDISRSTIRSAVRGGESRSNNTQSNAPIMTTVESGPWPLQLTVWAKLVWVLQRSKAH